jgi:hypothetical protein
MLMVSWSISICNKHNGMQKPKIVYIDFMSGSQYNSSKFVLNRISIV